nr:hypothetical protein [Candidatus Sigynarchaeota archaeon]
MTANNITFTPASEVTREQIGRHAETRFQDWMDANAINYLRVDQEPDTMALAFKSKVRRPDYIIHVRAVGATIAADVKSRKYDKGYQNFPVGDEDITRLQAFQQAFGLPVWLVLSTDAIDHEVWFWIALDQVLAAIPPKHSSLSGKAFYPIRIDQCKVIGPLDGIEKIMG